MRKVVIKIMVPFLVLTVLGTYLRNDYNSISIVNR
jgi:hypothetical protein